MVDQSKYLSGARPNLFIFTPSDVSVLSPWGEGIRLRWPGSVVDSKVDFSVQASQAQFSLWTSKDVSLDSFKSLLSYGSVPILLAYDEVPISNMLLKWNSFCFRAPPTAISELDVYVKRFGLKEVGLKRLCGVSLWETMFSPATVSPVVEGKRKVLSVGNPQITLKRPVVRPHSL